MLDIKEKDLLNELNNKLENAVKEFIKKYKNDMEFDILMSIVMLSHSFLLVSLAGYISSDEARKEMLQTLLRHSLKIIDESSDYKNRLQ